MRAGWGTVETSEGKTRAMLPHPLTTFEIQKYYQNEPRLNGIYSRDNLPKIEDRVYAVNFAEYGSVVTNWIALYLNDDNLTYFDSFGVEYLPKEIKKFIDGKNIITNFYRIRAHDSIMCRYFCTGFINFMLKKRVYQFIFS